MQQRFEVIVIGGGHAGVEAAWAAANLLGRDASVALVTQDPDRIGVMSCNPAIGGLAKGQLVREVDALGGLMGLATDAAGIQFRVLNTSKGAAVRGPRAQCDKHAYAATVQRMLGARPEISILPGRVESLVVDGGEIRGVVISRGAADGAERPLELRAAAVVLTTGTFMRGLMHTGEHRTPGGRYGEAPAEGISAALRGLGFELGRLKTGTPPRLRRGSIRWDDLEPQRGDDPPVPFSELTPAAAFPALPQVECRVTATGAAAHAAVRANLHRAPMYIGQIESAGPRYCPSLEDKVVRFAQRESHQVYLEPESLQDDWIYCNGISTSLPADVQDEIVRSLPGCEAAEILRYGYAVEYDMVRPHQIRATGESRLVAGLFLAGQINGTSGYEEAAAQGVVAGINAARRAGGSPAVTLGRDRAYIGVLMDDLVTKTPLEPYRMFTSRAEHRLTLRADNAPDRLTPLAAELGLLSSTDAGRARAAAHARRAVALAALHAAIDAASVDGRPLAELLRQPERTPADLARAVGGAWDPAVLFTARADRFYEPYVRQAEGELRRWSDLERRSIPEDLDAAALAHLRTEARQSILRFRPATLGQAGRLEGITPADVTLLSVLVRRHRERRAGHTGPPGDAAALASAE